VPLHICHIVRNCRLDDQTYPMINAAAVLI
jgi:hypothetical protein